MKCIIIFSFGFFLSTSSIQHESASLENYRVLQSWAPKSIYNDYTQERYEEVLDRFIEIMGPSVTEQGGELKILRDWTDGAVNAWAWREGSEYWLEVPGGAAKYHLLNEEAFLATLCHELGHLLGGAPASDYRISYEGQSDYYSASKCLRIVLPLIEPFKELKVAAEIRDACSNWPTPEEKRLCERTMLGALSLTSYYAELEKVPAPQISTPSPERAKKTKTNHPSAQCRFDTYYAGALCPVGFDQEISYDSADQAYCHSLLHPEFQRPACWYAN